MMNIVKIDYEGKGELFFMQSEEFLARSNHLNAIYNMMSLLRYRGRRERIVNQINNPTYTSDLKQSLYRHLIEIDRKINELTI